MAREAHEPQFADDCPRLTHCRHVVLLLTCDNRLEGIDGSFLKICISIGPECFCVTLMLSGHLRELARLVGPSNHAISFSHSKNRIQEVEAEHFCNRHLTPYQGRTNDEPV